MRGSDRENKREEKGRIKEARGVRTNRNVLFSSPCSARLFCEVVGYIALSCKHALTA